MRRTIRIRAVVVALALGVSGLVTAPAQAAVATTIAGRVIDATSGAPLRGIQVYAVNVDDLEDEDSDDSSFDENEGFSVLYATDSEGGFSGRAGGRLSPGTWVFGFQDANGSYVGTSEQVTLIQGANTFAEDITMTKGGTVRGVVTAPSGAQLKGVDVRAYDPSEEEEDEDDYTGFFFDMPYTDTDRDGTYELRGVPDGSFVAQAGFEDGQPSETVPFSISGPDDTADVDLTDVQVPVETHISGRTSTSKGRAGVSFRIDAARYGIETAGGTVRLKDGSRTIKAAAPIAGNRISFKLGGLTKGTHTFHVKYLGGVDTQRAQTISVKVKVK